MRDKFVYMKDNIPLSCSVVNFQICFKTKRKYIYNFDQASLFKTVFHVSDVVTDLLKVLYEGSVALKSGGNHTREGVVMA